jgi:DNA polymerase III delta prime subunit
MDCTELHSELLSRAFEEVLGTGRPGSMAFARCLSPQVVEHLATDERFSPTGWQVFRVADADHDERTITADQAVELREAKGDPVLLLVDTANAGAGMDGIYSAAQEVQEGQLFSLALRLAEEELAKAGTSKARDRAIAALKRARRRGRLVSLSHWTEFDYLVRLAAEKRDPGELLYLLGMWPAAANEDTAWQHVLDLSSIFVDRLLGRQKTALTPAQRIESLKLLEPSEDQLADLERFIRDAATKPLLVALGELAAKKHLWIGPLRTETAAREIQAIELVPWRTSSGRVARWSGLLEENDPDLPPVLVLKPEAEHTGDYSQLEVRWRAHPDNLERGAVTYRVTIVTDLDEEIAVREVPHTAKAVEKCRFTNDDFSSLSEDALISAKVRLSVIENEKLEPQESEEFTIRFGQLPGQPESRLGKTVRTFSEAVIELEDRIEVSELFSAIPPIQEDPRGFLVLRITDRRKSFRVFRPALIREVEQQWAARPDAIGRWRVVVRMSGVRVGEPEFIPFNRDSEGSPVWARAAAASRRMAQHFAASGGGVAQVYDESSAAFEQIVKEYLLSWEALLKQGDPSLALAHTVEVQSLSGRTVGLLVLPSHPLRVAWHVAYDNLVLHTAFNCDMPPKKVREEFQILDGSMFPAFLPGLRDGSSFVFGDTLGFHTVAMVPEEDKEPKATIAILGMALGESETQQTTPTISGLSADILGDKIKRYIDCHEAVKVLHVHAIRPGDGCTIARALGKVLEKGPASGEEEYEIDGDSSDEKLSFVLELYPSREQRGVAGRFIAEVRDKRRRGAGVIAGEDHWMLESIAMPGGVNVPRLRWARKDDPLPTTPAHVAVAFDTFDSSVTSDDRANTSNSRPFFAYGLLSFFEREYSDRPIPCWRSAVLLSSAGEKHPSEKTHTERLMRLHEAILGCVARQRNFPSKWPILRTEISAEKAESLRELHRLCDWVITLDRNAGIEYFDSPRTNRQIYDAYIIDCVPRLDDLGCLQLITSTSKVDEIRNLFDVTLDQMGLSKSRRNAEFLLEHLKALSGRLAIRLTGRKPPAAELIALALSYANCASAKQSDSCWTPLEKGFLIPVDDVLDLIRPLSEGKEEDGTRELRPDLVYVSVAPRRGLYFQFIEVKYRRDLRSARSADVVDTIQKQTVSLRRRWDAWYGIEDVPAPLRALRLAQLARVLRFYADKAHRHHLSSKHYETLVAEIDRMVQTSHDYTFGAVGEPDRGWVFCPEYGGTLPLELPAGSHGIKIFLFGPSSLPDSYSPEESLDTSVVSFEPSAVHPVSSVGANTGPKAEGGSTFVRTATSHKHAAATAAIRDKPPDDDIPSIVLGTDAISGSDVVWPLTVKGNPHLLVAGLPGMGKTTCLINLSRQMLEAHVVPIIFSYHQDIDERLGQLVGSVRFVDFEGLNFNPLQVLDRESPKAFLDVAGALRDIFLAIFPELGEIQAENIRRAIKESFIEQGWGDPNADLKTLEEPSFGRFVEILKSYKQDRGLRTLLARLEELADYGFFELAPSTVSLWDSEVPVVIRIHNTQNDNLQKAFASLVFYGLYKDMFRRGLQESITHAIVFDEAHRAAQLRLIATMAKECRKYGISLVLASQEAKDFNPSLFSAIANYLVLRLNETDARCLVRNVSSSDQERSLIDKIKQLERFRALYFCEGKRKPFVVKLLPA